ncbi:MAG: hypothetical protein ACI89L_002819 [Phycisphaerales bacterium]|jgi:hypothetical protein
MRLRVIHPEPNGGVNQNSDSESSAESAGGRTPRSGGVRLGVDWGRPILRVPIGPHAAPTRPQRAKFGVVWVNKQARVLMDTGLGTPRAERVQTVGASF